MANQKKKFPEMTIGGIDYVLVSSWEEQQQALEAGFINILYKEKTKKKWKRVKNQLEDPWDRG